MEKVQSEQSDTEYLLDASGVINAFHHIRFQKDIRNTYEKYNEE